MSGGLDSARRSPRSRRRLRAGRSPARPSFPEHRCADERELIERLRDPLGLALWRSPRSARAASSPAARPLGDLAVAAGRAGATSGRCRCCAAAGRGRRRRSCSAATAATSSSGRAPISLADALRAGRLGRALALRLSQSLPGAAHADRRGGRGIARVLLAAGCSPPTPAAAQPAAGDVRGGAAPAWLSRRSSARSSPRRRPARMEAARRAALVGVRRPWCSRRASRRSACSNISVVVRLQRGSRPAIRCSTSTSSSSVCANRR